MTSNMTLKTERSNSSFSNRKPHEDQIANQRAEIGEAFPPSPTASQDHQSLLGHVLPQARWPEEEEDIAHQSTPRNQRCQNEAITTGLGDLIELSLSDGRQKRSVSTQRAHMSAEENHDGGWRMADGETDEEGLLEIPCRYGTSS